MTLQSATPGVSRRRNITAYFESRASAEAAVERLVSAGFSRDSIRVVYGSDPSGAGTTSASATHEVGFWESLKELFLPEEDRHVYAEGLRRGGFIVSVSPTDANYDRALDILDDEGTIDIGERESSWRSQGWTGYTGSDYRATAGVAGGAVAARAGTTATGTARTGATASTGREEAIPVVEEQLQIGKREINQGRVRVRSYVVEKPVSETVNLRQENVQVERRPVDRPLTGADRPFQDRTIEVDQKSEEAVISKQARVKEEVVINKQVAEREQTVSDTVRRTEVEVQDERGNRVGGTTGTTDPRRRGTR